MFQHLPLFEPLPRSLHLTRILPAATLPLTSIIRANCWTGQVLNRRNVRTLAMYETLTGCQDSHKLPSMVDSLQLSSPCTILHWWKTCHEGSVFHWIRLVADPLMLPSPAGLPTRFNVEVLGEGVEPIPRNCFCYYPTEVTGDALLYNPHFIPLSTMPAMMTMRLWPTLWSLVKSFDAPHNHCHAWMA